MSSALDVADLRVPASSAGELPVVNVSTNKEMGETLV
jgi:hypothetical protein